MKVVDAKFRGGGCECKIVVVVNAKLGGLLMPNCGSCECKVVGGCECKIGVVVNVKL